MKKREPLIAYQDHPDHEKWIEHKLYQHRIVMNSERKQIRAMFDGLVKTVWRQDLW